MGVTLILTRNPLRAFNHGRQSGRWGQMIAVKGPKIKRVHLSPDTGSNSGNGVSGAGSIAIDTGVLELETEGGAIAEVKKYTSMERFRSNDGKGYYVQLHPKAEPYSITYESGNSAVKELRRGHDGRCFRVHGGNKGPEQGILIHEAPHVGWLNRLHFSAAVAQLRCGIPERSDQSVLPVDERAVSFCG